MRFRVLYDSKEVNLKSLIMIKHQQKISSAKLSEIILELTVNWLTDLNHVLINMII